MVTTLENKRKSLIFYKKNLNNNLQSYKIASKVVFLN